MAQPTVVSVTAFSAVSMVRTAVTWIWMLSGVLMIISVLLHSPKGDGMGGLASSGGSMFTSARCPATMKLAGRRQARWPVW